MKRTEITIATVKALTKEVEILVISKCIEGFYIEPSLDGITADLMVNFTSGGQYLYDSVKIDDIVNLVTADSVGRAYHKILRGKYKSEKLG